MEAKMFEDLKKNRLNNAEDASRIWGQGVRLKNGLPDIIKEQKAGDNVPVFASIKPNSHDFALCLHPALGKGAALFIEKGIDGMFKQYVLDGSKDKISGLEEHDVLFIQDNENIPYIYSFIKGFSLVSLDLGDVNNFSRQIIDGITRLPKEMFLSERGLNCFKQLLPNLIQYTFKQYLYGYASLVAKEDLTMPEKQKKVDEYAGKLKLSLEQQLSSEKIEEVVKAIQQMDIAQAKIGIDLNNTEISL